jgi:hypothetical protein
MKPLSSSSQSREAIPLRLQDCRLYSVTEVPYFYLLKLEVGPVYVQYILSFFKLKMLKTWLGEQFKGTVARDFRPLVFFIN